MYLFHYSSEYIPLYQADRFSIGIVSRRYQKVVTSLCIVRMERKDNTTEEKPLIEFTVIFLLFVERPLSMVSSDISHESSRS